MSFPNTQKQQKNALLSYIISGFQKRPSSWRVNRSRKCEVCQKDSYCLNDPEGRVAVCTRIDSGNGVKTHNGFVHVFDGRFLLMRICLVFADCVVWFPLACPCAPMNQAGRP